MIFVLRAAACRALLLAALFALLPLAPAGAEADDGEVHLTLVQMNDVYELQPLAGRGGLARVATLLKALGQGDGKHPVLAVLAGDLLSPSALGEAEVDGRRLRGRQMVAAMNALKLDFIAFGNHEFDLKPDELEARLDESAFTWLAGNITFPARAPYAQRVVPSRIVEIGDGSGATLRVGVFGLTLPTPTPAGIRIDADTVAAASRIVAQLRDAGRADIVIAVTHLPLDQDIRLAQQVPAIDLILGGHEHENIYLQRGPRFTPIAKADANARTVYVHRLAYTPATRRLRIDSCLQDITADLAEDAAVRTLIDGIVAQAHAALAAQGIDPVAVVATTAVPLDGREASVRSGPTALTELIAGAMLESFPDAQLALFNSGSIRIDDVLEGAITGYDVLRVLPYPGQAQQVLVPGATLQKALDGNPRRRGHGSFLQSAGVRRADDGRWLVGGTALDPDADYRVALNDFLLRGTDVAELGIADPANRIRPAGDARFELKALLIAKLKQQPQAAGGSGAPVAVADTGALRQTRCY